MSIKVAKKARNEHILPTIITATTPTIAAITSRVDGKGLVTFCQTVPFSMGPLVLLRSAGLIDLLFFDRLLYCSGRGEQ